MKTVKEILGETSVVEARKGAPTTQSAPNQKGVLTLFPKDFDPRGWQIVLSELGIVEGKSADWKTVQRVVIRFDAANFAYGEE